MALAWLATVAATLHVGGTLYTGLVEHPARLSCGAPMGIAHLRTGYRRQTWFLVTTGLAGGGLAAAAALVAGDAGWLAAGAALGSTAPLRGALMRPTARRLLDPSLQPDSPEARALLRRWAWVQAVPSAVGVLATAWMVFRLAAHP